MTTTTRTYWAILDKHGEERIEHRLVDEAFVRQEVIEYTEQLPHDAPYRLVRRTVTTVDEEVA